MCAKCVRDVRTVALRVVGKGHTHLHACKSADPDHETTSSHQMTSSNHKSLESWIWDAACSIRGAQEAPKFKDFILPLIFTKRLCDVFDDELNRIAEQV